MFKTKIAVLGPAKSGKTTISNILSNAIERFGGDYRPTKGVRILEFESSYLQVYDKNINTEIELWDCSGDQKYQHAFSRVRRAESTCNMSGKRPVWSGYSNSPKRIRKAITLDVKLEVLRRLDAGEKLCMISKALGLATSTLITIRDNRGKIMESARAATPASASKMYLHRSNVMENMERLLSMWIKDQLLHKSPLNSSIIQEKARSFYQNLLTEQGENSEKKPFAASKGWFERFKRRHSLYDINSYCETSAPDTEAADKYLEKIKNIVIKGGYTPQQVFNVVETPLYWKNVPGWSPCQYESVLESKASKDHVMLLLGGNSAGDFKVKPLLVYNLETLRAVKNNREIQFNSAVLCKSNTKAEITVDIFTDWFSNLFCPAVDRYCDKNSISKKALLILDYAPYHPLNLSNMCARVRVEYIPRNTTNYLQPMKQGAIATFQAYYLKNILLKLNEAIDEKVMPSVDNFWKNFSIQDSVDSISKSWEEVECSIMNVVWKNIWPDCVQSVTSISMSESIDKLVKDIVNLSTALGLEVLSGDVCKFLQLSREDFSDELRLLSESIPKEGVKEEVTQVPSVSRELTREQISKAFSLIEDGLQIFISNDPDEERSRRVSKGIHSTIKCYKALYKEKISCTELTTLDEIIASGPQVLLTESEGTVSLGDADNETALNLSSQ